MQPSTGKPPSYGKLLVARADGQPLDHQLKPGALITSSPQRANELLITGPGPIRIGRAAHNELRLDTPEVSADHALITAVETGCYITDLGSTYYTLLNGNRLEQQRSRLLRHGDELAIGPYRLRYERRLDLPISESWRSSAPTLPPEVAAQRWHADQPPQARAIERVRAWPERALPKLEHERSEYLQHLPALYHDSNLINDLLLSCQGVWQPIEEIVSAIACYSDPRIAPPGMLGWLASWFDILLDAHWSVEQQRRVIAGAIKLFPWRGTRKGLIEWISLLTGITPTLIEAGQDGQLTRKLEEHEFCVMFEQADWARLSDETRQVIERIIAQEKPVGTSYRINA